jgi:hypothetical protein
VVVSGFGVRCVAAIEVVWPYRRIKEDMRDMSDEDIAGGDCQRRLALPESGAGLGERRTPTATAFLLQFRKLQLVIDCNCDIGLSKCQ